MHDPFSTPFTYEVLENVQGGRRPTLSRMDSQDITR
jgi:hypothetical protein